MARVTSGYAYVVAVVSHVVVKKARKLFWRGVWIVTKPLFLNLRQGAEGAAVGLGACATARESHPPGL